MSLRDGRSKMSKSDPSDMSRINLTDDDDSIAQKIRKAKTDPEPLPDDPALLESRPEARNLVGIYAAVTDQSFEQVLQQFAGQGFGAFKPALAEALVARLAPLRSRLVELRSDTGALDAFLDKGSARARALAFPVIGKAYSAMGLTRQAAQTDA
jgi:tryptophanyl-tRNA synthetase